MKTKKILFAVLASVSLLAASCTSNSTADEDQLYEQGIEKNKLVKKI